MGGIRNKPNQQCMKQHNARKPRTILL